MDDTVYDCDDFDVDDFEEVDLDDDEDDEEEDEDEDELVDQQVRSLTNSILYVGLQARNIVIGVFVKKIPSKVCASYF